MLHGEGRSGYRQTEVGVVPEDWEVRRLGSLTDETAPIRYGVVQIGPDVLGGVPIVPIKHIKRIGIASLHRSAKDVEGRYSRSRILSSDILISIKGTIGRVGIVPDGFEGNIAREIARIRLRKGISPIFVAFQLEADHTQRRILEAVVGTTRLEFSIAAVRNFKIALPRDLQEQQRISEVLCAADAKIAALDALIAKKRDLKQAAMRQLLTGKIRLPGFIGQWKVERLGDLAEIVMGQSPSSSNYNTTGNGLPLVQGNADIKDRRTIQRIFTTEVTKLGKVGDILMSVRAPVGEIAIATFEHCLGRGVCAIRYSNDFLYHLLISKESEWAKFSKGSTFDSINSAEVKDLVLSIPSDVEEQVAIARVLSDMDAELAALEAKRDKALAIKQGLMQELLTGRIRLV